MERDGGIHFAGSAAIPLFAISEEELTMLDTIAAVAANVQNELMNAFKAKQPPTAAAPVLAFMQLGLELSPETFRLNPTDTAYNVPVAVEECSSLVNICPVVSEETYAHTNNHFENFYELVLLASKPTPSSDVDTFAQLKAGAQRVYEPTLGALHNIYRFHPAYATPIDWYDAANQGNWTTYHFSTEQSASTQTGPPPPILVNRPWTWKVAPTSVARPRPVFRESVGIGQPQRMAFSTGVNFQLAQTALIHEAVGVAPVNRLVAGAAPATMAVRNPVYAVNRTVMQESLVQTAAMAQQSSSQQVTSQSFSLSFDYCVVQCDRPWLSSSFLTNTNWFVPGYAAGAIAAGRKDDGAAPATFLPLGFIVAKRLNISGNWSASDTEAISKGTSFGPFSIMSRSAQSTSDTIVCDGMQIVAWFCQMLPALPPQADPALSAAQSSQSAVPDPQSAISTPQ
jgi:hypothetical protein